MRKILVILCFLTSFVFGNLNNSIIVIVEKEPITQYDLDRTMKTLNISKDQALAILINDKIELSQIKKMGIFVNDHELENELQAFLEKNNMTLAQFQASLKARKTNLEDFKNEFRTDLNKQRLYEAVGSSVKLDYSEEGARNYYNSNINNFTIYTQINTSVYNAKDPQLLERFRAKRFRTSAITSRKQEFTANNTDPRLLAFLSRVPMGEFSQVINTGDNYTLYFVENKTNPQKFLFEQVRNEVSNAYINSQRENFIKDFFDKLRARAQIKYIKN